MQRGTWSPLTQSHTFITNWGAATLGTNWRSGDLLTWKRILQRCTSEFQERTKPQSSTDRLFCQQSISTACPMAVASFTCQNSPTRTQFLIMSLSDSLPLSLFFLIQGHPPHTGAVLCQHPPKPSSHRYPVDTDVTPPTSTSLNPPSFFIIINQYISNHLKVWSLLVNCNDNASLTLIIYSLLHTLQFCHALLQL